MPKYENISAIDVKKLENGLRRQKHDDGLTFLEKRSVSERLAKRPVETVILQHLLATWNNRKT